MVSRDGPLEKAIHRIHFPDRPDGSPQRSLTSSHYTSGAVQIRRICPT